MSAPDLAYTANFLSQWEQFRQWPYDDANPNAPAPRDQWRRQPDGRYKIRGYITIGFGETRGDVLDRYASTGISKAEALALKRERILEFWRSIAPYIKVELNPNQAGALTSLAYNIGAEGFRSSTVLRRVNANPNDFRGIREAFLMWVNPPWARAGLTRRRNAESAWYATPAQPVPVSVYAGEDGDEWL